MKYLRTGLTEGTLIYNEYLKEKGLYSKDTENNFINWLYSTSGVYDKSVSGSYFDFDPDEIRESPVYTTFLKTYTDSLRGADTLDLMVHDSFWVPPDYINSFAKLLDPVWERPFYWLDPAIINSLISDKTVVINDVAPLYKKYDFDHVKSPTTFFNEGPDDNYFETLSKLIEKAKTKDADTYLISAGAYSVPLADALSDKKAIVLGSGLQKIFPVTVPDSMKPSNHHKIEDSKYW